MSAVQIKIIDPRMQDHIPKYQTPGSAGIDLRACVDSPLTVQPGAVHLIPTGISVFLNNPGLVGFMTPRSGLGHKHGIILGNSIGVIDSDYQGQMFLSVWNRSNEAFVINPLDRIAQYIVVPVVQVEFNVVDNFGQETERATGGFNSTGTN